MARKPKPTESTPAEKTGTTRPDVHELELVYPWWNEQTAAQPGAPAHELDVVYPRWRRPERSSAASADR